jgi:acyl carrier protein
MISPEDTMTTDKLSALAAFIADEILRQPGRAIAADEKLISSGLIDSFSLMDLALFVEDTFGVRIEDTELNAETFDTLEALVALIRSRES